MHALILSGGPLGDVMRDALPKPDFVIAADSGYRHAASLGLNVDVLIGDLDSIDAQLLDDAKNDGIEIAKYPVDKDASDLELAVDEAVERGATQITLVDGAGGRFDHVIGNALLLARQDLAHIEMSAILGSARAYVARNAFRISGAPGAIVSQFAIDGPVTDITIHGTEWAGSYDRLETGSSLCLHDSFTENEAVFTFNGTMLFVIPGE